MGIIGQMEKDEDKDSGPKKFLQNYTAKEDLILVSRDGIVIDIETSRCNIWIQ